MSLFSNDREALLRAAIEAFRPSDFPIPTEQVVTRALRFLSSLDEDGSDRVDEIKQILDFLNIAMVGVDLSRRDEVRERLTKLEEGLFPLGLFADQTRGLARFAQRLANICLYSTLSSDQRPTGALGIGYEVFADRPRGGSFPVLEEPLLPAELFADPSAPIPDHVHDVVVVGSGAGGSVVVRRLVEQHGLDVALVEVGDYVPEGDRSRGPQGQRRPLAHDEMDNLLSYYKHAGLQLTEGIPMFVFQGQCLGGTSVVNNAVCFEMPDRQRDRWAARHGVSWATDTVLDEAYARIAEEVGIRSADEATDHLNPSIKFLQAGALKPCKVNIKHDPKCLGCGYCNLTCAYLRKESVLQTMLPAAAAAAARGPGKLTIYTGLCAVRIEGGGRPFVATGVQVRGRRKRDRDNSGVVKGRKIVVAAGAIGSTGVLVRSRGLSKLDLPFGHHFSFNFGSPVHADFADEVRAFDGLQIGHFYQPPGGREGFVIETWYNPPGTQALALPGWMDDMDRNLRRYAHYACAAPLVGSSARSTVDASWRSVEEDIRIRLTDRDLEKLKNGLKTTCQLFFDGDHEPRRVLIGALDDWQLSRDNYERRIDKIDDFDEIQIGTGHPQGGNCISSNDGNSKRKGVVGPDFRVHGANNVWVADASVFPTSIGVNPHWTVMALADLASGEIAR